MQFEIVRSLRSLNLMRITKLWKLTIEIRVPKNKVFKSFTARQQLTVSFSNKKLKND